MERIKPGATEWERVRDMTNSRSNFSLEVLEGRLVASGGFNGLSVSEEIEIFDPETGEWTVGERMIEGKSGMASVVMMEMEIMAKDVVKSVTDKRVCVVVEKIERMKCVLEYFSDKEEADRESLGDSGDEEEPLELGELDYQGDEEPYTPSASDD